MTPPAAYPQKTKRADVHHSFLHPLDSLYAAQGLALPEFEQIEADDLPQPYRTLLAHENDMTPTLERFHASRIYIRVMRRERTEGLYLRGVALCLEEDDTPVEFGANRVFLERFPTEARWLILQEKVPLGRILRDHGLVHATRPIGFFRVKTDTQINRALRLTSTTMLYGRKALITDLKLRPLSEVVEILPPTGA